MVKGEVINMELEREDNEFEEETTNSESESYDENNDVGSEEESTESSEETLEESEELEVQSTETMVLVQEGQTIDTPINDLSITSICLLVMCLISALFIIGGFKHE